MARWIFICWCAVNALQCLGQSSDTTVIIDTTTVVADTLKEEYEDDDEEEDVLYQAPDDTLTVVRRSFNNQTLDALKKDPDFNYQLPPTVAESLWDRFLQWLDQLFDGFFDGAVNTNWGRVITYIIGLALLVIIIMLMLKVNAFKIIYSAEGASKKYNVFDENIHEMDFDKLVNEAVAANDFRKAIRLLFLYSLRVLSDKHLIQWEAGKTNHDYVAELTQQELKTALNEMSFYFEYAWYGNFHISEEMFQKVQAIFSDWKRKIS